MCGHGNSALASFEPLAQYKDGVLKPDDDQTTQIFDYWAQWTVHVEQEIVEIERPGRQSLLYKKL